MRKVRILVSIASAEWSYYPGQIVEFPVQQAATWIGSGLAEALEPAAAPTPQPAAKPGKKR